jgi:hypothetical protein
MYDGSHSRSDPHPDLRIERLYARLLRLDAAPSLDPALAEVLRLLAEVTRCDLVYVEITGSDGAPAYVRGHATSALPPGALRARVPRDVLDRAITERVTIEVVPRAATWGRAATALCTPIGTVLPIGALYVESAAPVAPNERERVESVARHLSNVSFRRSRQSLTEELRIVKERRIREAIERQGNIARAARVLGVSRTLIYRALGLV